MIELTPKVWLCVSPMSEAKISYRLERKQMAFFTIGSDLAAETSCFSVQLADIYNFVVAMSRSVRQNQDKVFVARVNAYHSLNLANAAILIGAYMIFALNMDVEEVAEAFWPITSRLESETENANALVVDIWKALQRVRNLGLLDVSDVNLSKGTCQPAPLTFDIDEYNHYADPANGGIRIIVPGRLIFMPSPLDLPEDRDWMSIDGHRRFSPAFYADLLEAEFSTSIVLRLSYEGDPIEYNPAAFEDRGIAVEGVPLGPRGAAQHHLLSAADRLIANLRGAPGMVAVHTRSAGVDAGDCAGTLLATGLMSVFGFGAGDAAAWLRLTCPPPCAAPAQLSTVFHGVTAAAAALNDLRGGLWRTASAPVPAACAAPSRPAWPNKLLRSLSS